jgi:progressive ankylosis protein
MAFADPAITTTLAHLPNARANLASLGIAKSLAIFFESPIIMILHASNALGSSSASRAALKRFTLLCMAILSSCLVFLALPPVFAFVATKVLTIEPELEQKTRTLLLFFALWPAAIAWRRYYQGLLIRFGHGRAVASGGIGRLVFVSALLIAGYLSAMEGATLGAIALVGGVLFESFLISIFALRFQSLPQGEEVSNALPHDLKGIWKFYWPLANSMIVIWGGRALLIGIIARSYDATLSLAVWPAAWGLILLVGNATRMVQQVIIRNRREISDGILFQFAGSVGLVFSVILLAIGGTSGGNIFLSSFLGKDRALFEGVLPVIQICSLLPLFIAVQNALQGFLIGEGKTRKINEATWVATFTLLCAATIGIGVNISGSTSAAFAMALSLLVEVGYLCGAYPGFAISFYRKIRSLGAA